MRQIDTDELCKIIAAKVNNPAIKSWLFAIINQVEFQSTPVRHGEWIPDDYMFFHCSECQYEHDDPEYVTPYCPNCGAKMEDER